MNYSSIHFLKWTYYLRVIGANDSDEHDQAHLLPIAGVPMASLHHLLVVLGNIEIALLYLSKKCFVPAWFVGWLFLVIGHLVHKNNAVDRYLKAEFVSVCVCVYTCEFLIFVMIIIVTRYYSEYLYDCYYSIIVVTFVILLPWLQLYAFFSDRMKFLRSTFSALFVKQTSSLSLFFGTFESSKTHFCHHFQCEKTEHPNKYIERAVQLFL